MTTAGVLWIISGTGIVLALISAVAERRRDKRPNLDEPGWVPWAFLQILGVMITFVAAALALMV